MVVCVQHEIRFSHGNALPGETFTVFFLNIWEDEDCE